jgi:hypothetical protein
MYLWVGTYKSAPGKAREAVAWLKESADYLNKAFSPAAPWQVYSALFGDPNLLYITSGWNSLADLERFRAWSRTDEQWLALLRKGSDQAVVDLASTRYWVLESR